ncbi:TPA: hypothetical protein HA242_05235 [Candidatus Woesearchaeota archaeon]|nr:hypothetical protein [Candidatus Woesearchaeota archaeon]HIH13101.1 hypothetical protein [Candidatus Woesearchaeota archaeon]
MNTTLGPYEIELKYLGNMPQILKRAVRILPPHCQEDVYFLEVMRAGGMTASESEVIGSNDWGELSTVVECLLHVCNSEYFTAPCSSLLIIRPERN